MKKIYKKIRRFFHPIRLYFDYYNYTCRKTKIIRRIESNPGQIKIVFFVINISMWKLDSLYEKFRNDKRFSPHIISFFVPSDSEDYTRRNQQELQLYFEKKGFSYYNMYDFENKKWFDIEGFSPDIVFYTQPYGVGLKRYNIKALWNRALFYYIPYCLVAEYYDRGLNTLLQNISHRVFAPTVYDKKYWSSVMINHGNNIVVTGYPSFDYLINNDGRDCSKWKNTDNRFKRVIWAPHHSILETDSLSYSNFLKIAKEMQFLAVKLKDRFQFVFKPHPRLRPKLEKHADWGLEKTDNYYKWWNSQDNTSYVDEDYFDLFISSDALVHDCSTFMGEYLCTGKPALFIKNVNGKMFLNDFGEMCFNHHYIGYNIDDIECFLNNVVCKGIDPMKKQREIFVEKYFKQSSDLTVIESIYHEIKNSLSAN